MNVTIIYGTTRKSSTYNSVQLLLNSLKLNINIKVTEFLLPKDLPSFNRECFSPLINVEDRHPHFNYVDSIVTSLDECDLIILASPVFTCDISNEMQSFLEHVSYHYIQNKTNYSMNNKIGLVMSTTTGAGLFHTTRTLKRKLQLNKKIFKLSYKILNLYINSYSIKDIPLSKMTSLRKTTLLKEHHCNVVDFTCRKNHTCVHSKT